jgi:hypothetical protein
MHNNRLPNLNTKDFNPYQPVKYGFLENFEDFSKTLTENTTTLVIGRSGLGKTAHAIYLSANNPGTILIQSSAGLSPHNMVKALCVHLGLALPCLSGSNDARMAHILANVSEKKSLIVFDNAEKLPLDTLALISQIANHPSDNKISFALIGLPILEQRFTTVSAGSPAILNIEPMKVCDIRTWVNQLLEKHSLSAKLSDKFFANLYHQTQGNPRQLSRLAPPMIQTEIALTPAANKKQKPKKARFFKIAAPLVFVLSIFGLSQPILTAKIQPSTIREHKVQPAAQKPSDIVTLVEARLTKDEQFVLKSKQDFIQIGATQDLTTMLKWISQKEMTEADIKVVRAIRNSMPYFIVLKFVDSEAPALHVKPWLRKYESIAKDIVEFAKIDKQDLLQA